MINLASETPYEITYTRNRHRQVATNRIKFNEMYQRLTHQAQTQKRRLMSCLACTKTLRRKR